MNITEELYTIGGFGGNKAHLAKSGLRAFAIKGSDDQINNMPLEDMMKKLAQVAEGLERKVPELWHLVYPKIYHETKLGRYSSAKSPSREMMLSVLKLSSGYDGETEMLENIWVTKLLEHKLPLFYVSPAMTEAISKTRPPDVFNWLETKLPFEAAVFMPPIGSIVHPNGKDGCAEFVSYCRVKQGEEVQAVGNKVGQPGKKYSFVIEKHDVFLILVRTQLGHFLHWSFDTAHNTIDLATIDDLVEEMGTDAFVHQTKFGDPEKLTSQDNLFISKAVHFLLGSLVMMLNRPDQLTLGRFDKRVTSKHHNRVKEFWFPHIIGEHYKLRKEGLTHGEHASPRGHWVRGFWRDQPYGHQHALRRATWIEPFWRGGDTK